MRSPVSSIVVMGNKLTLELSSRRGADCRTRFRGDRDDRGLVAGGQESVFESEEEAGSDRRVVGSEL